MPLPGDVRLALRWLTVLALRRVTGAIMRRDTGRPLVQWDGVVAALSLRLEHSGPGGGHFSKSKVENDIFSKNSVKLEFYLS